MFQLILQLDWKDISNISFIRISVLIKKEKTVRNKNFVISRNDFYSPVTVKLMR